MIQRYQTEGALKGLSLLDMTLTPKENEELLSFAATEEGWQPGRQDGGYFKAPIPVSWDDAIVPALRNRLGRAILTHIVTQAGKPLSSEFSFSEYMRASDFWLIYYPEGSFVPKHKDPAFPCKRHLRVNVALRAPSSGGELILPTCVLPLSPGQGVIFEPSAVDHSVNKVYKGDRLIVSFGAMVDE